MNFYIVAKFFYCAGRLSWGHWFFVAIDKDNFYLIILIEQNISFKKTKYSKQK